MTDQSALQALADPAGEAERRPGAAEPTPGVTETRWQRWSRPRVDGLPSVRVLLAFPGLVLAVLAVLVALGVSGTSSGVVQPWFEDGPDDSLIALKPQPIRSDEWMVHTVYTVGQVEQGLPLRNDALPGGVDMSMLWEVPYAEWSIAFRPHNLGFFVLPLDNAFALKWWLPGAALAIACSMFLVTLWPRRPVAAALMAVGFFFAPFFQWWYIPQTLWPPAWALFTMTAVMWMQGLARASSRWLWAVPVAYVSVTAALGIYAPFLVPCAFVVAAFTIGWLWRTDSPLTSRERFRRILPLLAAAATAGVVVGVFVLTRLDTVRGFLGTVYPGQRLTATGSASGDAEWAAPYLGIFGLALRDGTSYGIRPNSSEASTFVFVGAFVALAGIWLVVRLYRTRRVLDVPLVAVLLCGVLFLAFLYVPGWDALAHLLLLDRVTGIRMVLGLGLAALVLTGLVVRASETWSLRPPWWLAVGAGLASLVAHAGLAYLLRPKPAVLAAAGWWPVIAVLFAVAVVLLVRGRVAPGALAFLIVSGLVGGWVNPLYHGVFDLRETEVARAVEAIDAQDPPARWIGIGDAMVGSILTETGVGGFNAFQGAPEQEVWAELDPANRHEFEWNRFANVSWVIDPAQARIFNPVGDQIRINFRSCADYEQREVQFVLSDRLVDQPCVQLEQTVRHPIATYYIYSVVERP